MLQKQQKEPKPKDEEIQKIKALGAKSLRNQSIYRIESCVCSFLHAFFSHRVFGMEFLARRARTGCEGKSS
jgi:aspartyl/asparaginyl-tRNA synthetase